MGQKKKAPKADVSFELSRMMVPRDFLEYFEINEVKELSSEWRRTRGEWCEGGWVVPPSPLHLCFHEHKKKFCGKVQRTNGLHASDCAVMSYGLVYKGA